MSVEMTESNNPIVTGNAIDHGDENQQRGWFIGHFIDPAQGLRYTEEIEVKWGIHSTSEEKPFPYASEATTLTLLISGAFVVVFPELNQSAYLKRSGDYVIFAPGVVHSWKTLEDSVVLTVRWPSVNAKYGHGVK